MVMELKEEEEVGGGEGKKEGKERVSRFKGLKVEISSKQHRDNKQYSSLIEATTGFYIFSHASGTLECRKTLLVTCNSVPFVPLYHSTYLRTVSSIMYHVSM